MDHFAGLVVSVKETSVCIVDETGRIVREVKVASEPEALLPVLKNPLTTSGGLDWKPACEDVTQSEATNAAHSSPAASVQGDRY